MSSDGPSRPPGGTKFSHKTQKFTDHFLEVVSISNIRQRLNRYRYRVKDGSPAPEPPPYCPHWHKARPKPQKAWMKAGTERLSVYEPGQKSRLERYEERLLDPTSKESRQKAALQAGYSSTATTLCGAPLDPEEELVSMFERLRELERRNAKLVEMLSEERARALEEQPEDQEHGAKMRWDACPPIEQTRSGARSLGTVALKGESPAKKFGQHEFVYATQSTAFGWS